MIPLRVRIVLATKPVDFRKGPDELAALVRDAGGDPFDGALFDGALYVFRAKRADRIKIIWWDGTGLCLFAKRLEADQFCWPKLASGTIHMSVSQLTALVEGMDWTRVRSAPQARPTYVG